MIRSWMFPSESTREKWPLETVGERSNSKHTVMMREKTNSNCTRSPVLGASTPELRNTEYTNHQYMTKIFQHLQKKLVITAGYAFVSMEALNTHGLIRRMFMSSSMNAAIRLGPNHLTNLEFYKNTNFEEIESLFNMTQKLMSEQTGEILNVKPLESSSLSWTRSVLSHDREARVRVYSDSVLCVGHMNDGKKSNNKKRRSSGRIQDVSFFQKNIRNQWRSNGIRVEYFPRIFVIEDSSRDPTRFGKKEHQT